MVKKFWLFLASGFGIGFVVPFAPGTFASLPGVALAYALNGLSWYFQTALCLALAAFAVFVCDVAEKELGIKDDGRIAADEWMLYPIAFIGLPLDSLPWWSMAVFFAVVRFVDIVKPWPCRALQSIPGGLGIVIDDFAANIYSLAINWLICICCFHV